MLPKGAKPGIVHVRLGGAQAQAKFDGKGDEVVLPNVNLATGPSRLEAWLDAGEGPRGMRFVEVGR
jgi:hypothetical protein